MWCRALACAVLLACGGAKKPLAGDTGGGSGSDGSGSSALPTPGAAFDYQLGGAYTPPAGVTVVSRDRTATPASGLYNICYVNGFQIQPDEASWWQAQHPDLILRDSEIGRAHV